MVMRLYPKQNISNLIKKVVAKARAWSQFDYDCKALICLTNTKHFIYQHFVGTCEGLN